MAGRPGMKSLLNDQILYPEVRDWLAEMDGRRGIVKQLKARWRQLAADLGGMDSLSYQEKSLSLRLIHIESWIAEQEARLVRGEPVELNIWLQSINTYAGLLGKLGLKRRARPVDGLQALLLRPADPVTDEETPNE